MTARNFLNSLKNNKFVPRQIANRGESAISDGTQCHRPVIKYATKKAGVKHASLMSGKLGRVCYNSAPKVSDEMKSESIRADWNGQAQAPRDVWLIANVTMGANITMGANVRGPNITRGRHPASPETF